MTESSTDQNGLGKDPAADERHRAFTTELYLRNQQRNSERLLEPDKTQPLELFAFLTLLLRGFELEPHEDGLASTDAISELAKALGLGESLLNDSMVSVRSGTSPSEAARNVMSSIRSSDFDYSRVDYSRAEAAVAKYADSGNPLLEIIASVESGGNYNIMYNGTAKGATHDLTGRTVNEVIELQRQVLAAGGKGTAAGKGQIIRATLVGLRDKLEARGEDIGNELFDENMQDRLMLELLNEKGYQDFLAGNKSEADMMRDASKIWAAIPKNMDGESYYAGVGDNKAHLAPETMIVALRQARENHMQPQSNNQVAFNNGGTDAVAASTSAPNPSAQFDGEGVDQVALAAASDVTPTEDNLDNPDVAPVAPGAGRTA